MPIVVPFRSISHHDHPAFRPPLKPPTPNPADGEVGEKREGDERPKWDVDRKHVVVECKTPGHYMRRPVRNKCVVRIVKLRWPCDRCGRICSCEFVMPESILAF